MDIDRLSHSNAHTVVKIAEDEATSPIRQTEGFLWFASSVIVIKNQVVKKKKKKKKIGIEYGTAHGHKKLA